MGDTNKLIFTIRDWKEDTQRIVSGELTFYVDAKILSPGEYAEKGDYLAINEFDGDIDHYNKTGRCAVFEVSAVVEEEDYYIYALQPCRVEPHRRLTAAVYGGKVNNSEGVVGMLQSNKCRREEGGSDEQ